MFTEDCQISITYSAHTLSKIPKMSGLPTIANSHTYGGINEWNLNFRGLQTNVQVECRPPSIVHTCGDALRNTEVMNRRLQVVEVRVASFPIPEVFASKIKFLKVK